jgi:hypothetical protein
MAAASLRELSGKKVTLRNRTKFVEPIYEPASPPRCFDKGRGPVGCRRNGRKFKQLTHWGYIVSGPKRPLALERVGCLEQEGHGGQCLVEAAPFQVDFKVCRFAGDTWFHYFHDFELHA